MHPPAGRSGGREGLQELQRHEDHRADTSVRRRTQIDAETVPVGEAADDREAGLRDLADITDAEKAAAGDDVTCFGQPVLVQAEAAIIHLDDRTTLHGPHRDGHAGPRR